MSLVLSGKTAIPAICLKSLPGNISNKFGSQAERRGFESRFPLNNFNGLRHFCPPWVAALPLGYSAGSQQWVQIGIMGGEKRVRAWGEARTPNLTHSDGHSKRAATQYHNRCRSGGCPSPMSDLVIGCQNRYP